MKYFETCEKSEFYMGKDLKNYNMHVHGIEGLRPITGMNI